MTLLHCPQCGSFVEAAPGETARCRDCGFVGPIGKDDAAPPASTAARPAPTPGLLAPFAFLSAVVGVGTFYLSDYIIPFVASATAVGLGWKARRTDPKNGLALAAAILGGVGVLLAVLHFVIT